MQENCIFCKIANGKFPSWKVFESDTHMAFLTPFPNTPGFTVVASKAHLPSNILALKPTDYASLMSAAKEAAAALEAGLECKRVALIAEGMGVDHAHVKLIPLHGIPEGPWKAVENPVTRFSETYEGFITSHEGPRMSDDELTVIQERILRAQQ